MAGLEEGRKWQVSRMGQRGRRLGQECCFK